MRELIEYIVKSIVDEPDEVVVSEVDEGHTIVYRVAVAETDLGQVIGRRGRVANALRTLVAAGRGGGSRHSVEIVS